MPPFAIPLALAIGCARRLDDPHDARRAKRRNGHDAGPRSGSPRVVASLRLAGPTSEWDPRRRVSESRETSSTAVRRARRSRAARRRSCRRRRRPRAHDHPRARRARATSSRRTSLRWVTTNSAAGSNRSVLASGPSDGPRPPTATTRPSSRAAIRNCARPMDIAPTVAHCAVPGSKTSALASALDRTVAADQPPATRTRPSASGTASWTYRWAAIGGAAVHRPVRGSKISALARTVPAPTEVELPPVTRTRPSVEAGRRVVAPGTAIEPVRVHVLVFGS